MPHASLKLKPGIDVNETPTLNEAGISQSNLIRFIPDHNGIGLIQKLGGWTKYFSGKMSSIVRALWAWEDTNANKWLAAGMQTDGSGSAHLSVMNGVMGSNGITTATTIAEITPRVVADDVTVSFSTTVGSSIVLITDATVTGVTAYDSVYIVTPVSVGGVVLSGVYPVYANAGANQYQIQATNILGGLAPAAYTTSTGAVPQFTTTSGSSIVTVTLNDHGLIIGTTFSVLVSTTVGGVTLYGNYTVLSVPASPTSPTTGTPSTFTIQATQQATSSTSAFENGNKVRFIYSIGYGPPITATGYGVGGYGTGGYGTGTAVVTTAGSAIIADSWTLDNWGQILIACPSGTVADNIPFTGIYQWDPTSGALVATVIPQAPQVNDGVFVAMPQRQIIAWGSTFSGIQDPLLIRWCDVNNYNSWIAQITNQAGSYRIPKGSRIVGCIQGPQQGLVWTDLALWSMQYIGQPYVYSFNEIGTGCGLIAKRAAASMNGVVYWMGQSQFFSLSAGGVTPIFCPVWDVIFQDLDLTNLDKIRVAPNSRFGEVTWYYPVTSNGGEITNYVKYNVNLQVWDYGTLARTAWINESVLGPPIGADPSSLYIYQHETSPDADGQPMLSSFTTGYFALSEADVKTFIDQVWPDMKWGYYGGVQNATVNITFNYVDYPSQYSSPQVAGPYALTSTTQFISPRIRGRLVQINVNSSDIGSWWRIGNIRYRFQQDGKF
jgi:hypothetical protein